MGRQMALEHAQDERPEHVDPFRNASGHDHGLAAEQRDSAGDRGAERGGRLLQPLERGAVAGACRCDQRSPVRSVRRAWRLRQGPFPPRCARAIRGLSSPASAGSAQAQPKEAAAPPAPMHDPSIREHRRTDPRADREKNDVRRVSRRAERRFGKEGEVGVVAERHGYAGEDAAPGPARPDRAGSAPRGMMEPDASPGTAMPTRDTVCASISSGDKTLERRQIFRRRPMSERRRVAFASDLRQSARANWCRRGRGRAQPSSLDPRADDAVDEEALQEREQDQRRQHSQVAPAMTRLVFMRAAVVAEQAAETDDDRILVACGPAAPSTARDSCSSDRRRQTTPARRWRASRSARRSRNTIRSSEAPSMRPASMRSSGTPLMNCRIRKMPKALARFGAMTPASPPSMRR